MEVNSMNNKRAKTLRSEAIKRYEAGESATSICLSLGKTRQWLYKWLHRKEELSQNSRPNRVHNRTPVEIEEAVINVRKRLQTTKYAQIGVNAINWELHLQGMPTLPAATINRILKRAGLQRKKLPYIPKGKAYPKPEALCVNNIHQADIVGPRFIKGDGRFYSLNIMDIYTHRVNINPSRHKDDKSITKSLIRCWKMLGIPDFLQMDNELTFRGSNRYPHSLGIVLRLCLSLGIQPVFIPIREPWRNGEIESFQDTFDKAFFRSQKYSSFKDLCSEVPKFEGYHNDHYIYSCLNGKIPNQLLQENSFNIELLPESFRLPKNKIPIEDGYIHFYRFVRSDRKLDIFGEKFTVSNDLKYEYVKATICTEIHTLQIRHDDKLVHAFEYRLPIE